VKCALNDIAGNRLLSKYADNIERIFENPLESLRIKKCDEDSGIMERRLYIYGLGPTFSEASKAFSGFRHHLLI
jgi:hypothetical protein